MNTHRQPTTDRPTPPRLGKPLGIPTGQYIHRDHTVTGTPTQLANVVANHRNAGTLVALTAPRPVGDRFQVILRLREFHPAQPTVRVASVGEYARTRIRRPRRTRIAVIVIAATGVIAGLVTATAYLIGQVVELVTANAGLILGALALAALLAALAAHGSSRRRHCPGC